MLFHLTTPLNFGRTCETPSSTMDMQIMQQKPFQPLCLFSGCCICSCLEFDPFSFSFVSLSFVSSTAGPFCLQSWVFHSYMTFPLLLGSISANLIMDTEQYGDDVHQLQMKMVALEHSHDWYRNPWVLLPDPLRRMWVVEFAEIVGLLFIHPSIRTTKLTACSRVHRMLTARKVHQDKEAKNKSNTR